MKLLIGNIILLLGTFVFPLYIFVENQSNYSNIGIIQTGVFLVLFLGAITLTYLNHKNTGDVGYQKWFKIGFEIVGIVGIIYSATILYLLFAFRHGIGF